MIVVTQLVGNELDLARAFRLVLPALAEALVPALLARPVPVLYSSRIRYQPEPTAGTGIERWDDPWTVAQRGWGDCDDLVLYRLAELRARGEPAGVRVKWAGSRMHVQVRRTDGAFEDPSVLLARKNGG